jgi:hypothetical protein
MKQKLLLFCALLFCNAIVYAQYPNINGISTNPANPINPQMPSKKNTFFNWQDSIYAVRPITGDCSRPDQTVSPFFRTDNVESLRESKDMLWSDGWELIARKFGLDESNNYAVDADPDMTMILYNKYTGLLRVVLKICRGSDYSAASITIKFHSTSVMKTDLLEFSKEISPLTKTFKESKFTAGAEYYNNNTKWFYADFPMMYDPCTNMYQSKLNIISNLISTAQISLEGKVSGDIYSKDVSGKAQIQKPGSYSWQDFSGLVNGKVSTVNSSIDKFRTESQQFAEKLEGKNASGESNSTATISALDKISSFLKDNQFLKSGLALVPWIKSGVSVFDAFIGGGKQTASTQAVKLHPVTVNLTAKLNGSMTTTNPYHNVIFTNPGSKDANLDPANYPYYNEVLGIFNLLQTPEVFYERTIQPLNDGTLYPWTNTSSRVTVDRFNVDTTTIKYVLNPAAGLTIQEMKFALITEGVYAPSAYQSSTAHTDMRMNPDFFYEGKDIKSGSYKFRTDYFDAICLAKRTFKAITSYDTYEPSTYYGMWSVYRPKGIVNNDTTAYLKIMLNLKRKDATSTTQNVLYVVTYPVKLKPAGMMKYWINETSCSNPALLLPASVNEVNTFCNSSFYAGSSRFSRSISDEDVEKINDKEPANPQGDITVAPNPNNGQFTIYIKPQAGMISKIYLHDMMGRIIDLPLIGNTNLDLGYEASFNETLAEGTYNLLIVSDKKIFKHKVVVIK